MNSYAIDTHIAIERLKEVGFQANQAEVVTSLFTNLDSQLATKDDLKVEISGLRSELKGDISGLKVEITELRSELKEDMTGLRSELKEDISELKEDMTGLRSELKEDMTGLRSELKGEMTGLRSELKEDISELKNSVTKLEAGNTVLQEQIKSVRTDLQEQVKSVRYGAGIILGVWLTLLALIVPMFARMFGLF